MHTSRTITISSRYARPDINATPIIAQAVQQLCLVENGLLELEKGEYHLYTEGAYCAYQVATGFSAGVKSIAFPIIGARGLTIEGNGATLISHGLIQPFLVQCSQHVTIRNLISDTFHTPVSEFVMQDLNEEGFTLKFQGDLHLPHRIQNWQVIFENEGLLISTEKRFLSLHSMDRRFVQFLFAGDTTCDKSKLAAEHINTDAYEVPGGIRFAYRKQDMAALCKFREGERISILTNCGRVKSVVFLDRSENIKIQDFTIVRAEAMGIVALLCHNVELERYQLLRLRGNQVTSAADAIFSIHCTGHFHVHHCKIGGSEDDVINVHGIYSLIAEAEGHQILARFQHPSQLHFNPYFPGDNLRFIDGKTLDVVATAQVESSTVINPESGFDVLITLKNISDARALLLGCYIENPGRLPDITFSDNEVYDYLHLRLSGGKTIRMERNRLTNGIGVLVDDLIHYWYESGRTEDVVIRDNVFDGFKNHPIIAVGVSAAHTEKEKLPLVHQQITVENNQFLHPDGPVLSAYGLKKLILKHNRVDGLPLTEAHIATSAQTEIE